MKKYIANRSGIRQFITDNPGSTVLEVANGIGMDYKACHHCIIRMIDSTMLVPRYDKGCLTLTIGREPYPSHCVDKEASKAAIVQRQKVRNEVAKEERARISSEKRVAKAKKNPFHAQQVFGARPQELAETSLHCTDTFITNGGDHIILPPTWEQPMRYPRVSLSYQERSGRSGAGI